MRLAVVALFALALFFAFRWFTSGGEGTTPGDAAVAIRAGAPLIDVRTAGEYGEGHIAGARNVSVMDPAFREKVDDIDRSQTVYVYCASGHRSGRAAKVLQDMGFARVVNAGAFSSLAEAGLAVER